MLEAIRGYPRLVLVHGAMHGAWCWYKVLPLLRDLGVDAEAFDLPGHGLLAFMRSQTLTFDDYVEALSGVIRSKPGPVCLVGHSFGGFVATAAAENNAQVAGIVYVAALIPSAGKSAMDLVQSDPGSRLLGALSAPTERSTDRSALIDVFCGDGSAEDRSLMSLLLCDEPLAPLVAPVRLSTAIRAIPTGYVETINDLTVSPAKQKEMLSAAGCQLLGELQASHAPFFSKPGDLVARIMAFLKANLAGGGGQG